MYVAKRFVVAFDHEMVKFKHFLLVLFRILLIVCPSFARVSSISHDLNYGGLRINSAHDLQIRKRVSGGHMGW